MRIALAVGLIVLVVELSIMLLIESIRSTVRKGDFLENVDWEFVDPILLTIIVAPALYFLLFRTLNQQAELERKLDELRRFQQVTLGRELRMKELTEEIAALRNPLSGVTVDNTQLPAGFSEAMPHAAGQHTTLPEEESQRSALLFLLEDLENARRKIELAHHEWIAALDTLEDPIFLHDKEFRILRCNKAYQRCAGMPFKQIIGQLYYEVFPKNHGPLSSCLRALGEKTEAEEELLAGDAIYRSRAFSIHDEQGAYLHSMHILEDITESKETEDALKKSEALLRETGRMAKVGGWEFDARTGQGTWTEEVARIHDMKPEEQTSMKIGIGFYHGEYRQKIESAIRAAIEDGTPYALELEMVTAKGNHKWVKTIAQPVKNDGGEVIRIRGSFQDITERKQAEAAVQHANRALATLSAVNRELVRATVEEELLLAICQAIVEQRGYRMAWVGYAQHDEHKSIKIMAHAGPEGYLDAMQFTWAETERGMGPSGRAVRSGAAQLSQDIANDPQYLPWRKEALERGLASSIALPLKSRDDTVFGVLHVYAGEVNAFTFNEIDLLEELAGDLAFGVRSLHTRHERDLVMGQLQDSLEGTVRAIASMVEMRDPYTAGHQARVADLAVAIARQMELPDEQVHSIHLAGLVHDLGKIQVPAEILSKPGRLTDIEFSLIKVHPQAGYDILKGIDFPWPIAQMVLQHHERLDGTGYPQGLKGDAILLEARILSVADVVEAISAHRPYRPGLGTEVALGEITKNRSKYYDPQVVDVCVSLFRERGYQLPG